MASRGLQYRNLCLTELDSPQALKLPSVSVIDWCVSPLSFFSSLRCLYQVKVDKSSLVKIFPSSNTEAEVCVGASSSPSLACSLFLFTQPFPSFLTSAKMECLRLNNSINQKGYSALWFRVVDLCLSVVGGVTPGVVGHSPSHPLIHEAFRSLDSVTISSVPGWRKSERVLGLPACWCERG